jgi:hypothetical protein
VKRLFPHILCACILLPFSCKPSPPKPPKPSHAAGIASVGGLGADQLGPFDAMAAAEFPGADLVPFGGWNAYEADVASFVAANPRDKWIFAGHSMGADRVCRDATIVEAAKPGTVKLMLLYEPVCMSMGKSYVTPPPGVLCIVFRAENHLLTVPAAVIGPHTEINVPGSDHNNIISRPEVMSLAHDEIAAAL